MATGKTHISCSAGNRLSQRQHGRGGPSSPICNREGHRRQGHWKNESAPASINHGFGLSRHQVDLTTGRSRAFVWRGWRSLGLGYRTASYGLWRKRRKKVGEREAGVKAPVTFHADVSHGTRSGQGPEFIHRCGSRADPVQPRATWGRDAASAFIVVHHCCSIVERITRL